MLEGSDSNYYYSSSDGDEDEEEDEILLSGPQQDTKLWDSFQDPPVTEVSGSSIDSKFLNNSVKLMKIFTYWFVLLVVACSSVLSKLSLLIMTSNVKENTKTSYCDLKQPEKKLLATLPIEQNIAWQWAIIIAFSIPEFGAWLRALRLCIFKKIKSFKWEEFGIVIGMETLYVIGMCLFVFAVLPEVDVIQGVMLTNCLCLIPSVLDMLSRSLNESKMKVKKILDLSSIGVQCFGLFIWPLTVQSSSAKIWFLPIAALFISCHWWENYVSHSSPWEPVQFLAFIKDKCYDSRYKMFALIAPYKILLFFCIATFMTEVNLDNLQSSLSNDKSNHTIKIEEVRASLNDRLPDFNDITNDLYRGEIKGHLTAVWWILFVHAISSYICYIFGKFACKIQIQTFSFAFPINLTVPLTVSMLIIFCGIRHMDPCAFHGTLPDFIFFKMPPTDFLFGYIFKQFMWIWIFWLGAQTWVSRHLWKPKGMRNASTEKLFLLPTYDSLIIDQSMAMNRRRDEYEEFINLESHMNEFTEPTTVIDAKAYANNVSKGGISPRDHVPQIFICATMWHETKEELIEFLKSILRLDEDQCARRMAMKYLQLGKDEIDREYYDLETHIFFDDAFVGNLSLCESPEATPINSYVKLLIQNVEEAAWEVYKTKIKISKPTKIVTPYGGRLIWTLPGRTKMIAHLKDKNKIRHKKRWSQVMYMYYFLGYRIMQLDASPERKRIIAQNTYLLALDGDIDFQPNAVHLLIDRMKNDPDLGAACGRIHPIGKGPMVWYQKFEYAIGHWLQKATEHVIGCVLCSPGCFSLFRGRALMENSVMKKYTTKSDQARHYIQYDQGEDRWLCTLILKQKYRVEYCAASDAYTHAPEGFNEFYNQRRRWVPSTIANIFDLLSDAGKISKVNSNISRPYIFYQVILMFGTIIGPGTIFLMMVSAIQSVFLIDIYLAFLYNFVPLMIFMLVCYVCKQKIQLLAAFIISIIYSLIMMAVMVGITIQVIEDGILAPSSMFFFTVTMQIIITGILHPQEVGCLPAGFVYYVTIPCMYMLLTIYSLFNMNDVSWGTRENPQEAGPSKVEKVVKPKNRFQKILGYFRTQIDEEEEGSLDFSFAGLFRCMFCTHKKDTTINSQLYEVNESLNELSSRMKSLEQKLVPENSKMQLEDDFNDDISDDFEDIPLVTKEENKSNLLPDWLYDPDLKDGDTETISATEEQFWVDLIEKYLVPIDMTTKYKENMANQLKAYRDISTFAFVMSNALFVLIVFLLQLNKQYLRIRWPFNVLNDINFDQATFEFTIKREYTYLEPISMLFVLFFGLVLIVQFIAMLFHRFATISQILATTKIDWYCSKKVKDTLSSSELRENAVNIAKLLQKPRPDWEYEDDEKGNPIQRDTIHQLLLQQKKQKDWSNLETNFKRELFSEGEIKLLKKLKLSRKTIGILDEMRKYMAEYQKSKTPAFYMKNPYLMSSESLYSLALSVNSEKDSFTIYQRTSYQKSSRPSSPIPSVIYSSAQMPLKSALKKSKTAPSLYDENTYERGELNLSFVNDENEQEFVHDEGKAHNSVSFGDFSGSESSDSDDDPIEIKINDRT